MLKKVLAFGIVICCFLGCTETESFSVSKNTDGFWHKDSLVEFTFNSLDTIQDYNCYINIHANNNYKYSNLQLITSIKFPYGKVIVDTLEYKMAYNDGKIMGEGFGSLKYNKLWLKESVKFPEKGEYKISIRQAMRKAGKTEPIERLEGIEKIGFSYESIRSKAL